VCLFFILNLKVNKMSNISSSVFSRWFSVMFNYRKHAGSWAWILHRVTGLGLTFYILLHIIALTGLLKGEAAFNA
jgi:succinate dehydrogenase/fumarate reductase cytochrome b subunit